MNGVVIDASVLHDRLLDLLDPVVKDRLQRTTWYAPELVRLEVTNAARRRSHRIDAETAKRFIEDLIDLPIVIAGFETFGRRAWELRHDLTAYDAAYVALAELLDIPLVTRDARLAGASGIRCRVEVI